LWGFKQMKEKNESGITLLVLVVTVILMLILAVVTIGSFEPGIYTKIRGANENAEAVRTEQNREVQNAIEGLGGMD